MSDVFVSYARSTEAIAGQACETLRASGYSVWRDDQLPAHRAYGDVIEERLKASRAVLVLWSADAARSQWVRAEADLAREAGTLVQASVDGTAPPMPFNQIQCADLSRWSDGDDAGWRKVTDSIAELAGTAQAAAPAPPRPRGPSVCVLPFENMSGDPEQDYFSDGISEDITTDLSKISALSVSARNSAFTFKGQANDLCDVARRLGVSHVLEGSVRKAGGRVRINAQLIDGASGGHVWAERYDRDLTDIFAIQDEISKAIVEALKVRLLPEEKQAIEQRGTASAEAYNLYLMARQYWVGGNHGDRRREERVMRLCQRAVEIDPDYAAAWALMAIAQSNLRWGFGVAGDGGVAAAERALALDPGIAEVHGVKARELAERERLDEAIEEVRTGLAMNPESWELNKDAARLYMLRRQVPEAARHFEKAAAIMETDYHAWGMLMTCYQAMGDEQRLMHAARVSAEQIEAVLAQDPSNGAAASFGITAFALLGQEQRAREWMERALLLDPDNLNMRYNFACSLAATLHDKEGALALLATALPRAVGTIGLMEVDPDLDCLRDDPRFEALLADAKARVAKGKDDSGEG